MNLTRLACVVALAASASAARAEVKTQEVEYEAGGTKLKGFLASPAATKGKQPGVLVVHEWWGHNEHARSQAKRLAESGFVALALDMYGDGRSTTHPADAKAMMGELMKDPQVLAGRFDAALELLKKQPQVDPRRVAAVGYCMGGSISLGRARAGEDLDAVVAIHPGGLKPQGGPAEKGKVRSRILVLTGGADPFVPKDQVEAFQKEMKAAGVKAAVVTYPKAKHSFTNPDADKAGMDALGYDADAARKAMAATVKFLRQAFSR